VPTPAADANLLIALLGCLATALAATVIVVQMRRGKFFTLLTFYSALFLIESVGGAIKALFPDAFVEYSSPYADNVLPWVPQALAVSLAGFAFFLFGYLCVASLIRTRPFELDLTTEQFFERWWTPGFKRLLMLVTVLSLAAGFVQHLARIRAAGGFAEFLSSAYTFRFGTATQSASDTAIVVVGSMIGATAVPLMIMWIIAWFRHRLTSFEKLFVSAALITLLIRQLSTMFRSVLILTLISLFAAYASERRLKVVRWIAVGVAIAAILVAANFVHYEFYYLTGGWDKPGFLSSMSYLVAPQDHVYTLAHILATARSTPRLGGSGLLESFFFFVPRTVWHSKLDSSMYGTQAVQAWAGLPTYYQMAITAVGEWVAHFGRIGMVGMTLFGILYAVLDAFAGRGVVGRALLFGWMLQRVLVDGGMGMSAIAISIVVDSVFLAEICGLFVLVLLARHLGGARRQGVNRANSRERRRRLSADVYMSE